MTSSNHLSRRSFLSLLASAPLASALPHSLLAARHIPVGLELYSVRNALKQDLMGTVTSVAHLGYQCVEFYAPYYDWTPDYAAQVRTLLDSLRIRCYSTHNSLESFSPDGINKAIELNHALGTHYVVLASPGDNVKTLDGWKRIADTLNSANQSLASHGLHAGYHNHDLEWKSVDNQVPMELLSANTDKSIMLQLDVGTCVAAVADPVRWIESHPGRIRSMHCKDWSPEKGYRVLLGEGVAPWKKLFAAAESVGGLEYYLIEQEGSDYSELETAKRCLATFRSLHP
ncbi:MAG TPA: sugar phosphate isomerase/epimerase [Terriglobales bacterium]|nr:sugar phosphate isomerase/epimerase [Terriglobales bacterium]